MPHSPTARRRGLFGLAGAALLVAGCATNVKAPAPQPIDAPATTQPAGRAAPGAPIVDAAARRADQIRADPHAFIQAVAESSGKLTQYTVTMTRVERRGLLGRTYGPEQVSCWFRRDPFSVRMKWLDPEVKYGESTYVAGQHDGKVRFIPRHGLFGLPPSITVVDLQTPVTWGESKNPLTDFGLERMMERTVASMARAGDTVKIEYRGLVRLAEVNKPVHYLRLEYPPKDWKAPFHDLYIYADSELPAGSVLSLPDGQLDASYFYTELDADVRLVDADFLLEAERDGAAPEAADSAPTKSSHAEPAAAVAPGAATSP